MDTASFDLLSTAILLLDRQGTVCHANAAAEELLSVSRRVLVGTSWQALFTPPGQAADERAAAAGGLQDVLEGKWGAVTQELQLFRMGEPVVVSASLTAVDHPPWAVLVEARAIDHHALWDRQQQLGKEMSVQRESFRNLAHEVRNPLGGIRGAAQLLQADLGGSPLSEYTQVILAETDRLTSLVDRMLGQGAADRTPSRFNVHEICERILLLLKAEFPGIALRRDYDASVPDLTGNFEQLMQALLNIARNGAQALTESPGAQAPQLTVRTRIDRQVLLPGGQARLAVVISLLDNGPGVPDALHDRIFHPFVTGRAQGTGLGLHLAQEIAQRHGGLVAFDSRRGRTEFRLTLPLEAS